MSNEINIEELERLAKELIGSVPGTASYRDLSIVFTVTMSPDGVLSLIDRLKKAESDRDDLAARLEMDPDHGIPDGIDCRNATIEMQDAQISAMAAKLAELEGQYPVFAFRRRGLPDFCTCTEGRYAELAEKPHLFEVRKLYARPVPAEPVNVDFGKRGENMFFNIGNQSFLLDYKPEEQGEFEFMKAMLLSAFSRITHRAKTEIMNSAISAEGKSPTSQQEHLLQDMHDAGREIDRVMAEPQPDAGPTMTRDDVIRLALEAGFIWEPINNIADPLERFAALVADDVRARRQK